MNNQLPTRIIGLVALSLFCGCDGCMGTPPGQSGAGHYGAVLRLHEFEYGHVEFTFHSGDGSLFSITLTPDREHGGPFIHLSDGSVVDLALFSQEEHEKLLASVQGEQFNPLGYPPNVRHKAEHGRPKFTPAGELESTTFFYEILGHLDVGHPDVGHLHGPSLSRTRDESLLKLHSGIKLAEVESAWGKPDRIKLAGEADWKATPPGRSRYGTSGALYHLDRFNYGTITFVFHQGAGRLSEITLAPNEKEGGPFIHLSAGSVVDLAKYTLDDDRKLRDSVPDGTLTADGYPLKFHQQAELGERNFSPEGELISTVLHDDMFGRRDGPSLRRSADDTPLKLHNGIKLSEVKAAWGEPDSTEIGGENNRPAKKK